VAGKKTNRFHFLIPLILISLSASWAFATPFIILGYHNVTTSWNSNLMVTTGSFADAMEFLANHGYPVLSLDSAISHIRFGTPLPNNALVLTFDDAYLGEYSDGFPIMQSHNFPCTFFVQTYYIVNPAPTGPKPTWNDLRAGEATGLLDVESHTWKHVNLTTISSTSVRFELDTSKRDIEFQLSKQCKYIGYPNGAYNSSTVIAIAQDLGYKAGLTTISASNDSTTPLFEIRRIFIDLGDTLNNFKTKIGYAGGRIIDDPYIVNNDGNDDGDFFTFGSGWNAATTTNGLYGAYGSNYHYHSAGVGANTAKWTPLFDQGAVYEVYAWWTPAADRATTAKYRIEHKNGYAVVTVNQQNNGWGWKSLGQFDFPAGSSKSVYLTDDSNGIVVADAIKFVWKAVPVELSAFYATVEHPDLIRYHTSSE
jgi:peptidoglycan/xylan/chitin deacetylase (PgdA/CDA1 family)